MGDDVVFWFVRVEGCLKLILGYELGWHGYVMGGMGWSGMAI